MLIDTAARKKGGDSNFVGETFYGQLQQIFVVRVPGARALGLQQPETLILGAILSCKKEKSPSKVFKKLDMHFYANHGHIEVVDISTVQCLVGRLKDRKLWAIIDRSGNLARATFNMEGDR